MIHTDGIQTIANAPKEVIRAKTKKRCSRRVDREELSASDLKVLSLRP